MSKKTSSVVHMPWKRTLLYTAIALASHQALAAPECSTSIDDTVAGCEITSADPVVVNGAVESTYTGILITQANGLNTTLDNNGMISSIVTGTLAAGVYANGNFAGIINNNGTISASAFSGNSAAANAYGIFVDGALNGAISNNGNISVDISPAAAPEPIGILAKPPQDNIAYAAGIEITGNTDGSLSNNAEITVNVNSGTSVASAVGINLANISGELSNNGSITVSAIAAEDSAMAYGINIGSAASDITNNGNISVSATTSDDDAHFVAGVNIDNLGIGNTFTNDGSISAYAEGGLNSVNNGIYAIYSAGTGAIINNGSVSGAIYTDGDYTSSAGSSHQFVLQSVDSSTNYNSWIGGTGDLSGASLSVKMTGDSELNLADGDVFEHVVDSNNDLILADGQLGALQDNLLLYDFDLVLDADGDDIIDDLHNVDIVVSRKTMSSVAEGAYSGAANALEALYQADTACEPEDAGCQQLQGLIGDLNNANSIGELQSLLASVMPAIGGQTAFAAARGTKAVHDSISEELWTGEDLGLASGDRLSHKKVWAKIISSDASRDETDQAPGYDIESGGIVIGVDGEINNRTRVGVALAMTSGEIDGQGAISSQNVQLDNTQVLVYADWELGKDRFANILGGYGVGDNTITNSIGLADYESSTISLRGGYGSNISLNDKWSVSPVASLTYISVFEDAYTLGLINVDDRDADTLEASIDGNFAYNINSKAKLTTLVGFAYDMLGDKTEVDASFINGPAFSTDADQDAVSVKLGLGLNVAQNESTSFSVNYDFMDRGEFDSNTLSAKINHSF